MRYYWFYGCLVVLLLALAPVRAARLPAPAGETSWAFCGLRGPVKVLRGEVEDLTAAKPTRGLSSIMTFDGRGYFTETASYAPRQGGGVRRTEHTIYHNEYDATGRLRRQWSEYADAKASAAGLDTTCAYDARGRLTERHARVVPREEHAVGAETITTFAHQADGRVREMRVVRNQAEEIMLVSTTTFSYAGNTARSETVNAATGAVEERAWYNARGDETRRETVNAGGAVLTALFTYNTQGVIERLEWRDARGKQVTVYGAYRYDAHGNWTQRTQYLATLQHGKVALKPVKRVSRTIIYHAPPAKGATKQSQGAPQR